MQCDDVNLPSDSYSQELIFPILVALYRAMRLRCGYGFESCDANGPRNVKNTNIAKHRLILLPPLLLVGRKELVLNPKFWGEVQGRKRSTKTNAWVRISSNEMGVVHKTGWRSESSVRLLEPRTKFLAGCPGKIAGIAQGCPKKFESIFLAPISVGEHIDANSY